MYIKLASILIALLFWNTSPAQTYSSIVSDGEIYQFVNWLTKTEKKHKQDPKLKHKKVSNIIIKWDTANFIARDPELLKLKYINADNQFIYQTDILDSILNDIDRAFIFQQFTQLKDTIWHIPFVNSKLIENRNEIKQSYHYSVPVFSADKQHVIIHERYYCGDECAYGGFYVYRRNGKQWKYVTSINTWMS